MTDLECQQNQLYLTLPKVTLPVNIAKQLHVMQDSVYLACKVLAIQMTIPVVLLPPY